jgi:hypothetical protein
MAISDIYVATLGSTGIAAGTSSATAVSSLALTVKGSTAVRLWVVGIRVGVLTSSGGTNQVYFGLFRANNTPNSSTATAVTPQPHDPQAPTAAIAGWSAYSGSTWSVAPTVAAGTALWEQTISSTVGSSWEEFPPTGYEWSLPINSGSTGWLCLQAFVNSGTATVTADIIISQ